MRLGIVGTNFISEWLVEASRQVPDVEAVAVCSRARVTGEQFANRFGLSTVHESLEPLCADPEVDAVYIASPMYAHRDQTMTALAAGKDVLCEKTLGVTLSECEEMLQASERHGRVLLEEIRPLFDPGWTVIREALPLVGTLRRVSLEKNQYSSRYGAFLAGDIQNAFRPELGNSALGDIGIYCLAPIIQLFGAPQSISSTNVTLTNGFDAAGCLVLNYDGFWAEMSYSKISSSVRPSVIEGEKGSIVIDSVGEPSHVVFQANDGTQTVLLDQPHVGAHQNLPHVLAAFAAMTRGEIDPAPFNAVSRICSKIIDDAAGGPIRE